MTKINNPTAEISSTRDLFSIDYPQFGEGYNTGILNIKHSVFIISTDAETMIKNGCINCQNSYL